MPLSRLDLSQYRQAARRALAGRLRLRSSAIRNSISRRCRASRCYRGFIFGTLNLDAPPLARVSRRRSRQPIDEWLDRNPGGKVVVCEANRLQYKGNWKLAYDNSVRRLSRGLLASLAARDREPLRRRERTRACPIYRQLARRRSRCICSYFGHGHHFKDKRPNVEKRAGGLWAMEGRASRHGALRGKLRASATATAPRAARPRRLRAGEHQRLSEPFAARQPHPGVRAGRGRRDQRHLVRHRDRRRRRQRSATRPSTDINALRMRTQEGFPNFGEVDDTANFEEIQRGLACRRGRMGLHASRPRRRRTASRPTPTARSRRRPPTKFHARAYSRNGSG